MPMKINDRGNIYINMKKKTFEALLDRALGLIKKTSNVMMIVGLIVIAVLAVDGIKSAVNCQNEGNSHFDCSLR